MDELNAHQLWGISPAVDLTAVALADQKDVGTEEPLRILQVRSFSYPASYLGLSAAARRMTLLNEAVRVEARLLFVQGWHGSGFRHVDLSIDQACWAPTALTPHRLRPMMPATPCTPSHASHVMLPHLAADLFTSMCMRRKLRRLLATCCCSASC
jgi:hypothetical protein